METSNMKKRLLFAVSSGLATRSTWGWAITTSPVNTEVPALKPCASQRRISTTITTARPSITTSRCWSFRARRSWRMEFVWSACRRVASVTQLAKDVRLPVMDIWEKVSYYFINLLILCYTTEAFGYNNFVVKSPKRVHKIVKEM